MGVTFNAGEVLEIALQIERNGRKFYTRAAQGTTDEQAKKILQTLADWELEHEAIFKGMLDNLTDEERKMQLEDFKKAGVDMYNVSPERLAQWKKVGEKVNEEYYYKPMEKKGIDGRKIVSQFQALYKKYERK